MVHRTHQLFTSMGRPWNLSVKPYFKTLFARFPVEFVSLFTFIFVAQQFIDRSSFATVICIAWILLIYLAYLMRSHCDFEQFNTQLDLNIDEIVQLFHQLPNCNLFRDIFSSNSQGSTEWINCFLELFWSRLSLYFNKKFKNFELIKFLALENFALGHSAPLIESLSSNIISHNHEDIMMLNFNVYWYAKSASQCGTHQPLVSLKFGASPHFRYSIGSLMSFCFKANCQMRFRFVQWQMNDDLQLRDIQFSFTHPPALHHLHSTGFIWLLDNLQLIRPILRVYLNQRFLYPKRALFKFKSSNAQESRRPLIGCPAALFCIDVIQAENVPLIKGNYQKSESTKIDQKDKKVNDKKQKKRQNKLSSMPNTKARNQINDLDENALKYDSFPSNLSNNMPGANSTRRPLFNCFNYRLPSAFCNVRIFNQQFTSTHATNTSNPFWNFRSLIPIFSHNKQSIQQIENYHILCNQRTNDRKQQNPIDLNASFYQFHKHTTLTSGSIKQFISVDLLENLTVNIQLLDRQVNGQSQMIAEFQITDPSQYFLDPEFNGQSIWINSSSAGVSANVDQSIKLNVRFTFMTLNQTLNNAILSNAYLANRLAFPIGVMLVFVDSAIGLNVESLRSNLNNKSTAEYGFQIICKLGTQVLYTSICTDLSFIWENELLFCVYSLNLEKLTIKLVARSLNTTKFDLTTIATSKVDLSGLIYQPTLTFQQYVPLVLKSNPCVQLKLLLSFRIIYFTTKLITNCLRNAKVAEEDVLVKEKQFYVNEKLKSDVIAKQTPFKEGESVLKEDNLIVRKYDEPTDLIDNSIRLNQLDQRESNEEMDQSINSVEPISDMARIRAAGPVHILISVRMRWPKVNKFVIEIVDLRCAKFLALFQMYSIDVYLSCVLREKERALQSKRTKSFQLKTPTVPINQELQFNCITKSLSAYHLNISLHEKRTEEYNKVAEIYTPLPSLILASGQMNSELKLELTRMYRHTSGLYETAFSPDYADFDANERAKSSPKLDEHISTHRTQVFDRIIFDFEQMNNR